MDIIEQADYRLSVDARHPDKYSQSSYIVFHQSIGDKSEEKKMEIFVDRDQLHKLITYLQSHYDDVYNGIPFGPF